MARGHTRIDSFGLRPGRVLGGKYLVEVKLGGGWEGEVYKVVESRTGIRRAAKLFFPQRNQNDKAVRHYAKKLDRLRRCPIVIQYHHTETIRQQGVPITCLISDYVEGELLSTFIAGHRGRRLQTFEALHLIHALAKGLETIHAAREYHGDLHAENVLVRRQGIFYDIKLVDFYHWGAPTAAHLRDDVANLIRLFYDAVGGQPRYASQPPVVRSICRGLRRDLIAESFPTVRHLREHLESFAWSG